MKDAHTVCVLWDFKSEAKNEGTIARDEEFLLPSARKGYIGVSIAPYHYDYTAYAI